MSHAQWHYSANGRQLGPFALEQMRQMLSAGMIAPTDWVIRAGETQWLPARDVPELAPEPPGLPELLDANPAAPTAPPVIWRPNPALSRAVLAERAPDDASAPRAKPTGVWVARAENWGAKIAGGLASLVALAVGGGLMLAAKAPKQAAKVAGAVSRAVKGNPEVAPAAAKVAVKAAVSYAKTHPQAVGAKPSPPQPPGARPDPAEAHFGRGEAYFARGEYPPAAAAFSDAVRARPAWPEAHYMAGLSRMLGGDSRGAEPDLTEAIRLSPAWGPPYAVRAAARIDAGRFDDAFADADRAVRLEPSFQQAHLSRAVAHLQLGRPADAERDAAEASRLEPTCPRSLYYRGAARTQLGRHDEAVADFGASLRLQPGDADCHFCRGLCHAILKRFAPALADFAEARRLAPDAPLPYVIAANILATCPDLSIRNGPLATELADRACRLTGEKDYQALAALAAAHSACGRFPEAIRRARQAADLGTEDQKREAQKEIDLYLAGKPSVWED